MTDEHPYAAPKLGELDGEPVATQLVKVPGSASLLRKIEEGERVVLLIEGTARLQGITRDADSGVLRRTIGVRVEVLTEPAAEIADEVATYLATKRAELEGPPTEPLPFGDERDEAPPPDGDPDPDEGRSMPGWDG